MMLINTGIEPETLLQAALFPHFQHCYFGIHKLPDEIMTCVLTGSAAPSAFLSGAVTIPRYENYMTPDLMVTAILLQDPYVETATRMRWLKARAGDAADPARSWRLGPLAEAAAFADGYDFTDAKSLKRFFRMLPEPAYRLLYNPLTRQLGTRMPDDRLHPGNSIAAIEILARVGIVGHKARFPAFASTLFDRLGIGTPIPVLPPVPAETQALAQRLRGRQGGRGDDRVRRRHVGCREGLGRQELELIVRATERRRPTREPRLRFPGAALRALARPGRPAGPGRRRRAARRDFPGSRAAGSRSSCSTIPPTAATPSRTSASSGPTGARVRCCPRRRGARAPSRGSAACPRTSPGCASPIRPGGFRPGCAGSRCAASPGRASPCAASCASPA